MTASTASSPPVALHEPWEDLSRQRQAATMGMWIFLLSEMLLFGGLFAAYTVCRSLNPMGFRAGSHEADLVYGTINTVLLITSSLTMTLAVRAAPARLHKVALGFLAATVALGLAFLAVKGMEYHEDLTKSLFPGPGFKLPQQGAEQFFSFYWVMTGLHMLHMTAGVIAVSRLIVVGRRYPEWLETSPAVEATGLYWSLVDVIWMILYVLIYLPGRGG
ncbi:MAG: cytochrome c oxidase subunit 3 family protein [Alphaproteobacteria bacterium]|nr:cytochrome c oxidase subunit 3 family protein [Alphaproteobacteria bacterium]